MALTNATGLWDGAALNSTPNFNAGVRGKVHISSEDKNVLRRLASQVAEYASRPIEREKRELWRKHNDLEPTRPIVFCDPENGWNEIITDDHLQCHGWLAKRWEFVLRKELFWAEQLKDDKVIEPFFDIGYTHSDDDWGIHAEQIGGTGGGSYVWEAPLKDVKDIEKLHPPVCDIDYDTTQATLELAKDTFEGLLTVRRIGSWWWSLGLTLELAQFIGLEQIMLDMIDRPELIHRVMWILRDGMLQKLDFLEKNHLLSRNSDQYVGSGGFGYTGQLLDSNHRPVVTKDMWGFCESQETVGISPKMFARFVFPYQLPLLEKFGLNCYGCCEPLDLRWHIIKQIPNLRRISVSPWADLQKMAELLEDNYVFSMKPSPADLATPTIDEETIRKKRSHPCRANT